MTTLSHRDSPDWPTLIPTIQDEVGRARRLLGENASPNLAIADQAAQALCQASDALMSVLLEYGVETPLGWRLHQLRSRLDAHLLAARALADADAVGAVIRVLRRSLDLLEPELESLSADAWR